MTGSLRDRKDWITGKNKVQTVLHTNMYLPNHEDRDRLRATGEVFVYAKPLRATGWRMASVPIFLTGFRWEQNPDFRPHDENCMTKRVKAYSLWGIKHIGRLAAKIVRNLFLTGFWCEKPERSAYEKNAANGFGWWFAEWKRHGQRGRMPNSPQPFRRI